MCGTHWTLWKMTEGRVFSSAPIKLWQRHIHWNWPSNYLFNWCLEAWLTLFNWSVVWYLNHNPSYSAIRSWLPSLEIFKHSFVKSLTLWDYSPMFLSFDFTNISLKFYQDIQISLMRPNLSLNYPKNSELLYGHKKSGSMYT